MIAETDELPVEPKGTIRPLQPENNQENQPDQADQIIQKDSFSQEQQEHVLQDSPAREFVNVVRDGKKRLADSFFNLISSDKMDQLAKHALGLWILYPLEFMREWATGDDYSKSLTAPDALKDSLSWMNEKLPLSNLGNVAESYFVSFAAYYSISLLDVGVSKIRKKPIPETYKVGAAFLVGLVVNTALETMPSGDLWDMPGGVLGSLIFVGVTGVYKEYVAAIDQAIQDLKQKMKENKIDIPDLESETENLAVAIATLSEDESAD